MWSFAEKYLPEQSGYTFNYPSRNVQNRVVAKIPGNYLLKREGAEQQYPAC
jgi:hypothetical protein